MALPLLLHLPYSPWSERARWALDVRGVPYRSEYYQPILGEARLRRLREDGALTVPVLVTREQVFTESRQSARFAVETGGVGPTLFPEGRRVEIERVDALADRALDAGRGLALRRSLADPQALAELLPRSLRWSGPVGRAVSAWGIRRVLRKYGLDRASDEELRARADAALVEMRRALADGALVVLFPEGTTSDGRVVLPFKPALLEPAAGQGHPVTALRLDYALPDGVAAEEVCYWGDMTLVPHLWNLLGKNGLEARVRFGRADTGPGVDRRELARRLQATVSRLSTGTV